MLKNISYLLIATILIFSSCQDDLSESRLQTLEFSHFFENSELNDSLEISSEILKPGELTVFNYYLQLANQEQTELIEVLQVLFEVDLESGDEFSFSGDLNSLTKLQIVHCINGDCTDGFIALSNGTISVSKKNDAKWVVKLESTYNHNEESREILVHSIFDRLIP